MSNKFSKIPLSPTEKEKKAEEFIGFLDVIKQDGNKKIPVRRLEKEATKTFLLRVPETLFIDLKEIAALTGISVNSICLELLRPNVKKKLRELRDGD